MIEMWKPFYGGGQIHTWELCKRLVSDYNCNITIFTRKIMIDGVPYCENGTELNGRLKVIRSGFLSEYGNLIAKVSWILMVMVKGAKEKFDLIHAMPNLAAIPAKLIGLLLRVPVVFSIQGSSYTMKFRSKQSIKEKLKIVGTLFLHTKIKYSAEISDSSDILNYKNVNSPIVIYNGVDIGRFDRIRSDKERDYFKIIFVGRLHPQKGVNYLIEAVEYVKHALEKTQFLLIGNGIQESQLRQMVKTKNLESMIQFKGEITGNDLIREYKSSHLFVLPSVFEGQPLTVLEAWASKLPILVTDCGANKEIVADGENGWLVPAMDYVALGEKILHLRAMSESDREVVGNMGYELANQEYSWDAMAEKIHDVYEEIQ